MAAQHWKQGSDLTTALKSYTQADEDGVMVKVSRQACDEAVERIAQLEADLAAAQARADAMLRVAERYEAEAAALRADAERYRWLRKRNADKDICVMCGYDALNLIVGSDLDAVIDAAKESGNG